MNDPFGLRLLVRLTIPFIFVLLLSACGSGGGGGGPVGPTVTTFTIGGTITGLSGTVVLQNNGRDDLTLSANGSFTFPTALPNSSTYSVAVLAQPADQTCTVTSGTGTIAGANVTNVSATCVTHSLSPSQGPIAGGTVVTITGSGFSSDTAVLFNRNPGTNVRVIDSSRLEVTVPPLGSGAFATALATVRVSNASGATFREFLYVPPTFEEIAIGGITTIAGVGNFVGDGRLAPQALVEGQATAVDAAGNLYMGEENGGRVRKIVDGRIFTIAGTGVIGFSGDGGPATEAQFNWPAGVAVDRTGNIYIADAFGNNRIRKITASTGIVDTIAGTGQPGFSGDGGPATQAQLNNPHSIALDGTGGVYIVDAGNQRIRRIDASRIMTTIAGNGAGGYSGDGGPATQASFRLEGQLGTLTVDSQRNVYVVDFGNRRIRKIGLDGRVGTVVGGGTRAPSDGAVAIQTDAFFNSVAVDAQDRLIFSEGGGSIWRLETSGSLRRIAGNGAQGFSPDGVPALGAPMVPLQISIAPNGDLFVSERAAYRIRRVDAATGKLTTAAGIGPGAIGDSGSPALAAVFQDIGNIAFDGAANILAVEGRGSLRIRKIDPAGRMSTIAGIGVQPGQGFFSEGMPALSAAMSPTSVGTDTSGNTYYTDFCSVRRVGTDGLVRTVVGPLTNVQQCGFAGNGSPGTSALLAAEQDTLKIDAQGNVFIADVFNHRVRRWDRTSGIITTFAGSGPATGPGGYDPSPGGAFAGDGGPATEALLSFPTDVAFDSKRNICFADTGNFSVRCVDPQGIIRTVAGRGNTTPGDGGPATAVIFNPYRIAFDRAGNMYISDIANSTIRKVDADGTITTVAGVHGRRGFSGDGGPAVQANLDYGSGLVVDEQGNILLFDGANRRIRIIKQAPTRGPAIAAKYPGPLCSLPH